MYPKIRRPTVSWLLTVATGGIYLLFWVWYVCGEINSAEKRVVFCVRWWRTIALTLYGLVLPVGIIVEVQANYSLILVATAVFLLGFFIYVQISIGNYIKRKDAQLKTGGEFSNALSILLLWLVAIFGIAYMQAGINRVIRHERAHF